MPRRPMDPAPRAIVEHQQRNKARRLDVISQSQKREAEKAIILRISGMSRDRVWKLVETTGPGCSKESGRRVRSIARAVCSSVPTAVTTAGTQRLPGRSLDLVVSLTRSGHKRNKGSPRSEDRERRTSRPQSQAADVPAWDTVNCTLHSALQQRGSNSAPFAETPGKMLPPG
jgi:hypothetical protein